MKRCEREAMEIIAAIVEPHGCTVGIQTGGKHRGVTVTLPDGSVHKFAVSSSPENVGNMQNNVRQSVNAWLDRVGIGSGRGKSTGPAHKRRHRARTRSTIHRFEVALEPDTGPARDPWAALAGFRVNG